MMAAASQPQNRNDVPKVLIVDDAPANLIALGAVLSPLDLEIVEAGTGAEALEQAGKHTFAVVLLDVQMPEMDGFEIARRLRETPTGKELPILFLTAIHRDELYARKGYATGAADYITKPFDPDVLRARVKAFVDLFRQRDRLRVVEVGARTRERDDALERLSVLLESERSARREAEIANTAKDAFLATMSHELRTPLNAILGWAVIARDTTKDPLVQRALATIERAGRSQLRIIEDIFDMSRITTGKLRLEITDVAVEDPIRGAATAVRPSADAKGIALEVDIGPVGRMAADAIRLQQVVWNLLSNAIKFTPKGGHVALRAFRDAGNVTIEVRDDGEGIVAEFLPLVFDAFTQADGSLTRRYGGLGLGLAIVKQLVQAHGGTVSVESAGVGRGTTFRVALPAHQVVPTSSSPQPANVRLDGASVLVVDDDEDSSALLEHLLTVRGAKVTVASSSYEGLRALEHGAFDVILSDIAMPDLDGFGFIRCVRELATERGGHTPVIAVTADAHEDFSTTAEAAGFQGHLPKPIDVDRLVRVVAQVSRANRST